jgi:hypothetical protein
MWSRALTLLPLCILMACGGRRSEEAAETPEPVAETERRATDTLVTTRTVVDTTIVTIDTTIALDTSVVVDTTYRVDTTMVEGGRGEIVDTTQGQIVDTTE